MNSDEDFERSKNGLKTKQSSMFQSQKKHSKEDFELKVDSLEIQRKDSQIRLRTLVKNFLSALEDKTLPENKNSLSKQEERDLIHAIKEISLEMDMDETREMNAGVSEMLGIALACLLIQRNKINSLEFRISEIEKGKEVAD